MQYDIVGKRLLELGGRQILKYFLGIDAAESKLLDIPVETTNIKISDYAIRVKEKSGKIYIVILELQSYWLDEKILDLIDYTVRFQKKYQLPVRPVMMLLTPSKKAHNFLKTENLTFQFELLDLSQYNAEEIIAMGIPELLPLVPLMKISKQKLVECEEFLYTLNNDSQRADLLSALAIFSGLKNTDWAEYLFKRRRDIMIASPVYDWILTEGIEKGIEKGIKKGIEKGEEKGKQKKAIETARRMVSEGFSLDVITRMTGLTQKQLREAKLI